MNIKEAVERACQEPTFIKALSWLAVWESERVVEQALEWNRTGIRTGSNGGAWDTCFEHTFDVLLDAWKGPMEIPEHCRELNVRVFGNRLTYNVTVTPPAVKIEPRP